MLCTSFFPDKLQLAHVAIPLWLRCPEVDIWLATLLVVMTHELIMHLYVHCYELGWYRLSYSLKMQLFATLPFGGLLPTFVLVFIWLDQFTVM